MHTRDHRLLGGLVWLPSYCSMQRPRSPCCVPSRRQGAYPPSRRPPRNAMGFWEFIALVIVAAIVGAIGEAIAGYSHAGCATSVIVGFVGAYIGRFIQTYFHWPILWTVKVG